MTAGDFEFSTFSAVIDRCYSVAILKPPVIPTFRVSHDKLPLKERQPCDGLADEIVKDLCGRGHDRGRSRIAEIPFDP